VEAVLQALDLMHVCDTPVGDENMRGVSGGQRKRTNVGLELAAAPLALFLDEPTSGLDSTSALVLCDVLQQLARRAGVTVAMVIHQPRPEIFDALDELLVSGLLIEVVLWIQCMTW
jgi:ABC-type multidrug transport system ATPase subunit